MANLEPSPVIYQPSIDGKQRRLSIDDNPLVNVLETSLLAIIRYIMILNVPHVKLYSLLNKEFWIRTREPGFVT